MKPKSRALKATDLPPIIGNTREELRLAPPLYVRMTPGFENTLTLTDEAGTPRGYIDLHAARFIANWLRSHFPNL